MTKLTSIKQITHIIILLFITISCVKKDEFDFDKLSSNNIEWSPELNVPLGSFSISTDDILNGDNITFDNGYIMYDESGVAHIIFNGEKLFEYEFGNIVEVSSFETPLITVPSPFSTSGTFFGWPIDIEADPVSGVIELPADNEIKFSEVRGSSSMELHFTNQFTLPVIVNLSFSNLKNHDVVVSREITIPAISTTTEYIDLDDLFIDFTSIYPLNEIGYNVSFKIESTSETFTLAGTEVLSFYATMADLRITEAKGDFGKQIIEIDPGQLDMDIKTLQDFDGDIEFTDPKMTLFFEQSMVVPFTIDLGLQGVKPSGLSTDFNFNNIIPEQITDPDNLNGRFISSYVLTKSNSDIAEFFKNPDFDQINYNPVLTLNPTPVDVTTAPNIIRAGSKNEVSMSIDLPFIMKISNLERKDTIKDIEILQNIESATLYFNVENGMPFEAELSSLDIIDSNNDIVASIDRSDIFTSGSLLLNDLGHYSVDTTAITKQYTQISIDKAFTSKITKSSKMIIGFNLNTSQNGSKAVALHDYDKIKVGISVEIKANTAN